ncbi:heavy metal translocating P-type ATPase [Pseudarthrobacter sp. J1738]|uniref:heavy metal translocating P-type ATPase n=1 Tax=Pseudarthrobacter sp. J1738 TaxID=3420446 RepID=UPI003D2B913A
MTQHSIHHTSAPRIVELDIEGMTCASCVNRVERKLGKIEGVEATVNLPLESAHVSVPESVSDQELLDVVAAAGYKARLRAQPEDHHEHNHTDHMTHGPAANVIKPRLILAIILTVPVFLISMIEPLHFPNWGWVVAILALPVVTWSAWPFHRAAAINARHLASTMDTLVSIGVIAAYLYSAVQLIAHPTMTASSEMSSMAGGLYFEVAAVVTTFLLLGRFLEAKAKAQAGDALKTLLSLGAKDALVLRDGQELSIPASELIPGDVFVVKPGTKIATDGVVVGGNSAVDTSLVTGESLPRETGPGDAVTGATINTSGRLLVRATRVGSETTLAQMGRLVSQAQTGKAPIARLADKISGVFVPVVLGLAVLTFVLWLTFGGGLNAAVTAAVAVLVIACPCALGLATPVGLLTGTGRGAQLGILIKGPQVLEDTRTVDTIVLDKTGTVTSGQLSVESVLPMTDHTSRSVLMLAGALEAASEHPLAQAITAAARSGSGLGKTDDAGGLASVENFNSAPGGGVSGNVSGAPVLAGRSGWLLEQGVDVSTAQEAVADAEASGGTAIVVAADGVAVGVIVLRDSLKPGSVAAIAKLKELGLRPVLLTGDNQGAAEQVAAAVGIDPHDVFAGVQPAGKVAAVRKLQEAGAIVAMAGDGVNDAAALAQADLGIAMGSGTDVAMEAADLTVMGSDLNQVVTAIELSRATLKTIKTNLFWAFFYNAIGIPVAALGLLNPMIAGAAMAASSVLVVANSLRLRSFGK